jgi:hypothetical protein
MSQKEDLTIAHERHKLWRKKQIQMMYGSGRPLFNITNDNCFERKMYDCEHFFNTYIDTTLDNKHFVPNQKWKLENGMWKLVEGRWYQKW